MKHAIITLAALLLAAPPALYAQSSPRQRPVKKLIEYGWDVPYPDQVRKDIRNMEKKPFDGVIFPLRGWNHAFDPRPWDETQLKPQFDDLAAIEWQKFTDNFLCLYAANNWKMDWFNDEQWQAITANLRLSAKAAKIGRCVGLVFDPEPYGDNPWAYPGMNPNRTFAKVEAQVHKRGAQFMTALQTELPNVRLLTFFHYLTPAERLRFFEHNVYYALTASDEYVWCYSERMSWWQDKVPDGAEAAIRAARELVAQGRADQAEKLRADVAEIIGAGQKKMAERGKKN